LQRLALPDMQSAMHGPLMSRWQVVGQSPSHRSPASRTPFPHFGWQSLSLFALAPGGQQPSPFVKLTIRVCEHTRLQLWADPTPPSSVQGFPSSQVRSHRPSQVSPSSITPLPHTGWQSLSLLRTARPTGTKRELHEVT
jgi:hypothetical protein